MNAVQQREQANKQKAVAEMEQALKDIKFPGEHVPHDFRRVLNAVLATKSRRSAECDWPMFKSLIVDDVKHFSFKQVGVALNAIESTSSMDLGCVMADYIDIMEMQEELSKKWNELWTPIAEAIVKKYASIPPLFIPHGKKK